MAFNTGNIVPSTDAKDLSDNAENFDGAINAQADTWADRLGVTRDTVTGRLKKMGYAVPVAYAVSIVFGINDNVKTVEEAGVVYAPLPSALPFTTSGTFIGDDDARFFVVQGLTVNQSDAIYSHVFDVLLNAQAYLEAVEGPILITEIEAGKGGRVEADYVTGETANDMDVFDHDSLPLQIKFRARDKKPAIAFMFDDAWASHYIDALPLFEARSHPLAFAITPKFTAELLGSTLRLTTSQMLDGQKRGVEIINHSMTHENLSTTTSLTSAIAEIETARQWLEDRGLNNVGYLAASSALNQDLLDAVSARLSYGLTVFANNDVDIARIDADSNQYALSRLTMDGVAASATIDRIKESIKFGSGIMAYDHDVPNPSAAYTDLVAVLDFIDTIPDLIDVILPKDLVSKFIGVEMKQLQHKDETLIFDDEAGWSFPAGLGYVPTDDTVNKQIELTPIATGAQTGTRDVVIDPDTSYTFSNNIRSGSWTGTVSMGVHMLDSGDAVIADYSVETENIEYDGENLQRQALEFHTPTNAAKVRLFYRINPTVADATTLLIRNPAIHTGRKVTYKRPADPFVLDETEVAVAVDYTPDLDTMEDINTNEQVAFLRLDLAAPPINAPINGAPTAQTIITFIMRANGTNRNPVWNAAFIVNPNTVFNVNSSGMIMQVSFRWYRSEWHQINDTAWAT